MFYFDPLYFILILPALLLASFAQSRVRGAYQRFSRIRSSRGISGAEVARAILADAGVSNVDIEYSQRGALSDHYDPRAGAVRLSRDVHDGRTLASLGIAAHEVGHALQHATGYAWLGMRNAIIPITQFGSTLAFPLFFIGLLFAGSTGQLLMYAGLVLFGSAVAFQLITLPVEYNASARAMRALETGGYITSREAGGVRQVLNAAALTYLAAALMALMQFIYLFTLQGRRR
ncbi:MAG: zinc metallopeptidase [Bacillota bacterium]